MIEIIRKKECVDSKDNYLDFHYRNSPMNGFSFPCDEQGNVDESKLHPAGLYGFRKCKTDPDICCNGVITHLRTYTEPAVGRCHCGAEIKLGEMTNTCEKCGREYNWNGTDLAPREQWEETFNEY